MSIDGICRVQICVLMKSNENTSVRSIAYCISGIYCMLANVDVMSPWLQSGIVAHVLYLSVTCETQTTIDSTNSLWIVMKNPIIIRSIRWIFLSCGRQTLPESIEF